MSALNCTAYAARAYVAIPVEDECFSSYDWLDHTKGSRHKFEYVHSKFVHNSSISHHYKATCYITDMETIADITNIPFTGATN